MDEQPTVDPVERIAELEAALRQREAKIKELTTECDEALELVDRLREEAERHHETIDQWIEVFEMQQDERDGKWVFDPTQSKLWEEHATLWGDYNKLFRDWNKFVGKFNAVVAPRKRGRPLAAGPTQPADVLKRRKAGESLRMIAKATSLSLQTVRTIVDKAGSKDRTTKRTNALREKGIRPASRCRLPGQEDRPRSVATGDRGAATDQCGADQGRQRAGTPMTTI
jgi:hypothetical protein